MTLETPFLKLTAADVEAKLNPTGDAALFRVGETVTEAHVFANLSAYEQRLVSNLPARYANLLLNVPGEFLFGGPKKPRALGGETAANLSLFPCSNVHLWRNFPFDDVPWGDRWRVYGPNPTVSATGTTYVGRVPATRFTANPTTGAVALADVMVEGDVLVAEYSHAALSTSTELRLLVLDMVLCEYARTLPYLSEGGDGTTPIENTVYQELRRLTDETKGLWFFDRISLVDETRTFTGRRHLPPTGGF